jgi:hypothetical protein
MSTDHLSHLIANPHHRVQDTKILIDDRYFCPEKFAELIFVQPQRIKLTDAEADRAAGGRRLRRERAVVVLPEPDSPNSPTISPAAISKLILSRT